MRLIVLRNIRLSYQQIPLLFLGCLAALLSMNFTVRGCWQISPDLATAEIIGVGVLFEVAKILLGPKALHGVMTGSLSRRAAHLPLLVLVMSVMAFSVALTVSFTNSAHDASEEQQANVQAQRIAASSEYQYLRDDLAVRAREIDSLVAMHARQSGASYFKEAAKTSDRLATLREQRDEVAQRLQALQSVAPASNGATKSRGPGTSAMAWVARKLGVDVSALQQVAYLCVAILIEFIAIAATVMFHVAAPKPSTATTLPTPGSGNRPLVVLHGGGDQPRSGGAVAATLRTESAVATGSGGARWSDFAQGVGHSLNDKSATACSAEVLKQVGKPFVGHYERVRELITRGEIEPQSRAVQRAAGVSQRPAQRILNALYLQGVIVKDRRGYKRAAERRESGLFATNLSTSIAYVH